MQTQKGTITSPTITIPHETLKHNCFLLAREWLYLELHAMAFINFQMCCEHSCIHLTVETAYYVVGSLRAPKNTPIRPYIVKIK